MKLQIEFIKHEEKTSKNGKPYTTCSIKASGEYYNGFGNAETKGWKVGDEVEVEAYEEEYNGKMYKKFKTVKLKDSDVAMSIQKLAEGFADLRKRVAILEGKPEVDETLPPSPF